MQEAHLFCLGCLHSSDWGMPYSTGLLVNLSAQPLTFKTKTLLTHSSKCALCTKCRAVKVTNDNIVLVSDIVWGLPTVRDSQQDSGAINRVREAQVRSTNLHSFFPTHMFTSQSSCLSTNHCSTFGLKSYIHFLQAVQLDSILAQPCRRKSVL